MEFLIHWKGAPNSDDSWESLASFVLVQSKVWQDYCREQELTPDVLGLDPMESVIPRVFPRWNEPTDPQVKAEEEEERDRDDERD